MAIRAVAGSPVLFIATVQDRENRNGLAGVPVLLERFDQPAGAGIRVGGGATDSAGQVQITTNLPGVAGTVEYQASTPGLAGVARADLSRRVAIEAVVV